MHVHKHKHMHVGEGVCVDIFRSRLCKSQQHSQTRRTSCLRQKHRNMLSNSFLWFMAMSTKYSGGNAGANGRPREFSLAQRATTDGQQCRYGTHIAVQDGCLQRFSPQEPPHAAGEALHADGFLICFRSFQYTSCLFTPLPCQPATPSH